MAKARLFDIRHFPMDLGRLVCSCLPLVFRLKRVTADGKPYKQHLRGGAIVAANHTSMADPFLVGITFWYRRMYCLAAEVVMKNPVIATLSKGMGCIKVDRNIADIEAIKKSVSVLKEGHVLAMFPQGQITVSDEVDTVKSGAVLIALQAGVPIIPMFITKRKHWYNHRTVVIGEKIVPSEICGKKMPSTADIEMVTDLLAQRLQQCKDYSLEGK